LRHRVVDRRIWQAVGLTPLTRETVELRQQPGSRTLQLNAEPVCGRSTARI
jgi:hypothetical protein